MIDWASEHLLSCVIFMPLIGAGLLCLLPSGAHATIQRFAFGISAATLILSVGAAGRVMQDGALAAGGFALEERADWIAWSSAAVDDGAAAGDSVLRIQYAVGIDGISLPLLL
ncbi:MAG: hypothetical protein V3T70_06575, partial [Phycisphaerae bacterium]